MDKEKRYPLQILLLEDDENLNNEYKREIEKIKSDSFKVNVQAFKKYGLALEFLKANYVEMVVTDKNIDEDDYGLSLLNYLKEEDFYPEAIIYSNAVLEEKEDLKGWGITFVPNATKDTLISNIRKKLESNSKRFGSQIFLRGVFITKFVDLELEINKFLHRYFLNGVDKTKEHIFDNYLLDSKYNSFENKSIVLCKVVSSDNEYKQHEDSKKITKTRLNNLAIKRNTIAHSGFENEAFNTRHKQKDIITKEMIREGLNEIKEITNIVKSLTDTTKESPKDK